ncbi:hypothetical protein SAMN04488042_101673 [Shimia aestuarii]|uniref:Uncharacterized protein n=1 Tax=Shimia aestuarii TaxID=254406 RepID=A0A1I4IMV4_9RHOB|nr:hypothetical protein SAMN04488042_101673 [Shimia aestuarii]
MIISVDHDDAITARVSINGVHRATLTHPGALNAAIGAYLVDLNLPAQATVWVAPEGRKATPADAGQYIGAAKVYAETNGPTALAKLLKGALT